MQQLELVSKFYDNDCNGEIYSNDNWRFTIKGIFSKMAGTGLGLRYWAASPTDLRMSYSGAGLPFPNSEIALQDSPNVGMVQLDNSGAFEIVILRPNAYYVNQGMTLIPPQLSFRLDMPNSRIYNVKIGDPIPHRSLSSLPGCPQRSTGR